MSENFEQKEQLWTGALTLEVSGLTNRQFGFVHAESPTDKQGVVTILLRIDEIDFSLKENSLEIRLPEISSLELKQKLSTAICRIQHLRVLNRLGLLSESLPKRSLSDQE